MRLLCISDLHGLHDELTVPPCDVLVVAGDVTAFGRFAEVDAFGEWLRQQPYHRALVVAGNHDTDLYESDIGKLLGSNILHDAGCYIGGLKFWGFPWVQKPNSSEDKAFTLSKSSYQQRCRLIPKDVDVLISHARIPPEEIGHTNPRLLVFGHAPYRRDVRYGVEKNGTHWVYASLTTRPATGKLRIAHGPVRVELADGPPVVDSVPVEQVLLPPPNEPQSALPKPSYFQSEYDDGLTCAKSSPVAVSMSIPAAWRKWDRHACTNASFDHETQQTKDLVARAASRAGISAAVWLEHRVRAQAEAELSVRLPNYSPVP